MPGVGSEAGFFEGRCRIEGHGNNFVDGETFITRGKCLEQFDRAAEKAGGRLQPASVDAVRRFAAVMLQMHVRTGELDEGLVEDILLAIRPEPDVLEDIVRGVVFLPVEEPEVFKVAGVPGRVASPSGHPRGNPLVFTHGVCGSTNHRVCGADRVKNVTDRLGCGGDSANMTVL